MNLNRWFCPKCGESYVMQTTSAKAHCPGCGVALVPLAREGAVTPGSSWNPGGAEGTPAASAGPPRPATPAAPPAAPIPITPARIVPPPPLPTPPAPAAVPLAYSPPPASAPGARPPSAVGLPAPAAPAGRMGAGSGVARRPVPPAAPAAPTPSSPSSTGLILLLIGIPLFLILLAGAGIGGYYYYTQYVKNENVSQGGGGSGDGGGSQPPGGGGGNGDGSPPDIPPPPPPSDGPLSPQDIAREMTRCSVLLAVKKGLRTYYQTGCIIDTSHRLAVTSSQIFTQQNNPEITVYFPMYEKTSNNLVHDFSRYKSSSSPAFRTKGRAVLLYSQANLVLLQLQQLAPNAQAAVLPLQSTVQPDQKVYTLRNTVAGRSKLWQLTQDTVQPKKNNNFLDDLEDLLDANEKLLQGSKQMLETFGLDELAEEMKADELQEMIDSERQMLRSLRKLVDPNMPENRQAVFATRTVSDKDVNGGPVANDNGELVGLMVQRNPRNRQTCFNIRVSEIENLVNEYFKKQNQTWTPVRGRQARAEAQAKQYVEQLLQVVEKGTAEERSKALQKLGEQKSRAQAAIPVLLRLLPTADPKLQQEIEQILYLLGAPSPEMAKALLDALDSSSPAARLYAAKMFAQGTPTLPDVDVAILVAKLSKYPPEIQKLLVTAIGKNGELSHIRLIELAEITQGTVQAELIAKLYALPPPDASCTAHLVKCLQSPSPALRNYAIRMFANNTPPLPQEQLALAVELLKVAQGEARRDLYKILKQAGLAGRSVALGVVLEGVADPDAEIAELAKELLATYGQAHINDKPLLLEKLRHNHPEVRQRALTLLVPLCSEAEQAKIWVEAIRDPNLEIRRLAAQNALKHPLLQAQLEQLVPPLFKDTDLSIRRMAVQCLQQRPQLARGLLVELIARYQGMTEDNPELAQEVALLLAMVVPPETQHLILLRDLLRHSHGPVRREAALRLKEMKTDASEAVPDLIERLQKDEDLRVRAAAVQALQAIGPRVADKVIPILDQILTNYTPHPELKAEEGGENGKISPQEELLIAAIQALGSFGTRGRNILEAHCRNTRLSFPAREAIGIHLASLNDQSDEILLALIELAEQSEKVRPAIAEAVIRRPNTVIVNEMLLATSAWKPPSRAGGQRNVPYPLDYRSWAIDTLGRLRLNDLNSELREKVIKRLTYLAENDSNPQINAAGRVALKRLQLGNMNK